MCSYAIIGGVPTPLTNQPGLALRADFAETSSLISLYGKEFVTENERTEDENTVEPADKRSDARRPRTSRFLDSEWGLIEVLSS